MVRSQIAAAAGAWQQQVRMTSIIANNLSNAQTTGFKQDVLLFRDVLGQARMGAPQGQEAFIHFAQGNIQKTGNPLDLAIQGEGLFKVQTEAGIRYTRAGNFKMNAEKKLTNAEGYPLLGRNGAIPLRGKNIEITLDGSVLADGNRIDQISLVTFPDLQSLVKEGHTLYQGDATKEIPAAQSEILQGALEGSNVNPMEEMIKMIESHRAFESCIRFMQAHDSLDSKAVNELGRL